MATSVEYRPTLADVPVVTTCMELTEFHVERYRNFKEPSRVPVRRVTLLLGYNSAGKSALLRLLPLIASSGRATEPAMTESLALQSEAARGASFRDLRCRFSERNALTIGTTWTDNDGQRFELSWTLEEDVVRGSTGPIRYHIASATLGHRTVRMSLDSNGQWEDSHDPRQQYPIQFSGLRVKFNSNTTMPSSHEADFAKANRLLDSLAARVHWLGAVRAPMQRRNQFRARPTSLDSTGAEASLMLAYDHIDRGPIHEKVNAALREMFDQQIEVKLGEDDFQLRMSRPQRTEAIKSTVDAGEGVPRVSGPLRTEASESTVDAGDGVPRVSSPLRTEASVSIVDVGEGVPQVLPVLVLGAMAANGRLGQGPLLALEQPEMHLHPKAERALARFIVEEVVCSSTKPRCIIESHSENLLLFIQLAVAKGKISPEDVAICWIESDTDGPATVRTITLDKSGTPNFWPPGLFSEDVAMARELLLAKRRSD